MCTQVQLNIITDEVTNSIKDIMGNKLYKIILYGSYARGDFNEDSDIDIMVLTTADVSEFMKYRKQVNHIASRIGLDNDIIISVSVKDKDNFYGNKDVLPFYKNVLKEGIELNGEE